MRITSVLSTLLIVTIFAGVLLAQTPSTCRVECEDGGGVMSLGSGVLIAHGTGPAAHVSLVATAAHVVSSSHSTNVVFQGTSKRIPGKLAAIDRAADVAILCIDKPKDVAAAPICTKLSVGDRVVREGYPRAGPLRAVRTAIRSISGRYTSNGPPLVQVTASAISGESGGPVYDSKGNVVALVCTTSDSDSQGPSGETILATLPHDNWRHIASQCGT